jgi:hypothetical protein
MTIPQKKDPSNKKEALDSEEADEWRDVLNTEAENLQSLGTNTLVRRKDLPPGARVRVYKIALTWKYNENRLE